MESPEAVNDDFNLSTAASTTVLELAETHLAQGPRRRTARSATSRDPPFEHDVQLRVPDVRKAREVLGFEATTTARPDARRGHPVDPRRSSRPVACERGPASPDPMKRLRPFLPWILGLVGTVAAIAAIAISVDVPKAISQIHQFEFIWLVPALAALTAQMLFRATRWSKLLTVTAGRPIRVRRILAPLLVGYLANNVLPARAGEAVRTVLVSRRELIGLGEVAATVITERVLDLVTLAGVAAIAVWLATGGTGGVGLSLIVLGVGGFAVGRFLAQVADRRHWLDRLPANRLFGLVRGLVETIGRLPLWVLLLSAGFSLLAWGCDAIVVLSVGRAVGADLPGGRRDRDQRGGGHRYRGTGGAGLCRHVRAGGDRGRGRRRRAPGDRPADRPGPPPAGDHPDLDRGRRGVVPAGRPLRDRGADRVTRGRADVRAESARRASRPPRDAMTSSVPGTAPELSIVMPVFKEGEAVEPVLRALTAGVTTPHELVVVYDFDEDTTVPVIARLAAELPAVRGLRNDLGRGVLNAMKAGIAGTPGAYVLISMADGSDEPHVVDPMVALARGGADVVVGVALHARRPPGRRAARSSG